MGFAMAIEKLRYVLLMVLVVTISWVAGGIGLDTAPQAAFPYPGASLCIHRPGS